MKKDFISFLLVVAGFLLLAYAIAGCNSQKACERKLAKIEMKCPDLFKFHNTDSIKTVIHETKTTDTVLLPGATNTFTVTLPCPEARNFIKTSHFKAGNASLSISNGIATVKCPYDSLLTVFTTYKDSIFKTHIIDKSGIATQTVSVFVTHWYDYFCRTVVLISLVFLIIWVALHSLKMPLP